VGEDFEREGAELSELASGKIIEPILFQNGVRYFSETASLRRDQRH
jgi:hypothetical protein